MIIHHCTRFTTLITAIILLVSAGSTRATDYYVDVAIGDDNFTGLSEAQPWQTINKVNNFTFQPGDNIYFKQGEVWRETLYIPNSGADGSPITLTSYPGTGDPKPIISCADDISNDLWHGVISNGGFEFYDENPIEFPGWTPTNLSLSLNAGHQSPNAARLQVTSSVGALKTSEWHMESGVSYTVSGSVQTAAPNTTVGIQLYTLDPLDGTQGTYLEDNDMDGVGSWVAYDSNNPRQPFFTTTLSSWDTFIINFTGEDQPRTFFRIGISSGGEGLVDNLKIVNNDKNYYSYPRGVFVPKILIEDGVRLAFGAEWDDTYQWHSVGSASKYTRYIPPSGTIPSDHLVEVSARRLGIGLLSKNYIVVDNLTVEGCESAVSGTSEVEGAGILLASGSSFNTVNNVLAINNDEGIRVQGDGSNGELNVDNTFTNIEIAHGISQGIALRSYARGNLISNCLIYDLNNLESDHLIAGDKEPVSIGGNTGNDAGNIVEHCEIHNIGINVPFDDGANGINVFNSPQTIVRYNYLHDIGVNGMGFGSNSSSPNGWLVDGTEIYGNVITRTGISSEKKSGQGIGVTATNHSNITGIKIYNNTITNCELYDNKDAGISLRGVKNPDDLTLNVIIDAVVKNNIVSGCSGQYPRAFYAGHPNVVDIQNLDANNNQYFPDPSVTSNQSFTFYQGTSYTKDNFAQYQQETGLDGNSNIADPEFIGSTSDNYHITFTSPAKDSGADMGLQEDFDGNPIIGQPDIGAFEFSAFAASETTDLGVVAFGNLTETYASDDIYEVLQEESGQGRSKLEHKWTFNISGHAAATFRVEAWHNENDEGDDLIFSYSTNDVDYTDLLIVTKTADDNTMQSQQISGLTGDTIYIKARDANRSGGKKDLDLFYVDLMYVQLD